MERLSKASSCIYKLQGAVTVPEEGPVDLRSRSVVFDSQRHCCLQLAPAIESYNHAPTSDKTQNGVIGLRVMGPEVFLDAAVCFDLSN